MGSEKCEKGGLDVDVLVNSHESGLGVNSVRVIGCLSFD